MSRAFLAIAIVAGFAPGAYAQTPKKPNIIFILADDLGYGDLGCYGQKKIKTPNLDRLAKQGMRFTQAYAGSTVCAPSRCVLMTGKHTGHAHIRGNSLVPLRPEDITIATLLKRAGYVTGLIGKWGLGEPGSTGIPTKQGFDYFFGYLNQVHAHNYYPDYLWRNEEKVPLVGNVVEKNVATKRAQYSHDLFAEEALRFVEKNKEKPFFLYLAFTIPHANNEAGKLGMEVPSDEPYAKEAWPQPQRNHAAMITRMDRDIGRLLQKLHELGIDENTIIFFASDNGPHQEGGGDPFFFRSSGPLRGIKRSLHEGGVRIPMIVRWPGRIPADQTSPHVWAFWDFLPTAAELAGAKTPDNLDGISVVPTLLGKGKQRTHEFLYWEFHEKGFQQAVRMGDWKAIRSKVGAPLELYDLAKDLGEEKNIADRHADVVARIESLLEKARTDSPQWPVKAEAKKKAPPKQFTSSIGMKFVWIPPGTFVMGSPQEEKERQANETEHKVTLTKGFYMGVYSVTQEEWQAVTGKNPSHFKGKKNLPVEMVSWQDCQEFAQKLREKDKQPYRLPTEAEWEYACRAGTTTPHHFGETIATDQANYWGDFIYGNGKKGVFRSETTPVGSFPANAWGLHDMHGNVWQWCQDWHGKYPEKDVVDPQGPEEGESRVLRGGSWRISPSSCRSAYRYGNVPGYRISNVGVRLCFSVP